MSTAATDLQNPDLTRVEWLAIGERLGRADDAVSWRIGDWINVGAGRSDWGDIYALAVEITGRKRHSLSQMARVARCYPPGARHAGVTWSSHRDAMGLPEGARMHALVTAQAERWGRDRMRAHVEGLQRGRWKRKTEQVRRHQVVCPHCGRSFRVRRKGMADAPGVEADVDLPMPETRTVRRMMAAGSNSRGVR